MPETGDGIGSGISESDESISPNAFSILAGARDTGSPELEEVGRALRASRTEEGISLGALRSDMSIPPDVFGILAGARDTGSPELVEVGRALRACRTEHKIPEVSSDLNANGTIAGQVTGCPGLEEVGQAFRASRTERFKRREAALRACRTEHSVPAERSRLSPRPTQ